MAEEDIGDGSNTGGDGDGLKQKLDTFRESNRELMRKQGALEQTVAQLQEQLKARDQKLSTIGDNDPDTVKSALQLLGTVQDQAESELIKAGRFDEVVSRRMKPYETKWQSELKDRDEKLKSAAEREQKAMSVASNMLLERQLRQAVASKKLRMHPSAEDDLMMRARNDWKVPNDLEGDLEPANPNNISEDLDAWIESQVEKAPHLWEGGSGGGAKPGKVGSDGQRVVKRSELTDREYGRLSADIASGKVRVVQ